MEPRATQGLLQAGSDTPAGSETHFLGSCLTAPGEGGLHVFRVDGGGAARLLEAIFRPGRDVADGRGLLRRGRLVDGTETIDEVLLFEEQDGSAVEISTHGGTGIRGAVEALLARNGVRFVAPGSLPASSRQRGRAVLAEARFGLTRAFAPQALLFHLAALEGRLVHEILSLRAGALALAQARDRGEGGTGSRDALAGRLRTLLRRTPFGMAHGRPPALLLAGPANAGKSTLANRLLGRERCIVTAEAGTTRDLVGSDLVLSGYPFRLLDSAGLRATDHPVERAGVQRALEAAAAADLVLLVLDGTEPVASELLEIVVSGKAMIVLNKCDLSAARPAGELEALLGRPVLAISAREGLNVDRLIERILFRSVFRGPVARDLPCPFTDRQRLLLERALDALAGDARGTVAELDRLLDLASDDREARERLA